MLIGLAYEGDGARLRSLFPCDPLRVKHGAHPSTFHVEPLRRNMSTWWSFAAHKMAMWTLENRIIGLSH
jgi:hypothetical protein